MRTISVNADRAYSIEVGAEWRRSLESAISDHEKVLIIAPKFIVDRCGLNDFVSPTVHLFETPEGEDQKSIPTWNEALHAAGSLGLTRSDAIVAIGGGATTDLAGFVAASWLRGITWYAIPTTLAGAVDASIGGKTGINSEFGKNLIGAFYSPAAVHIDLTFLESLSDRDFSAGLAEVIKTGYIGDPTILEVLRSASNVAEARKSAEELIYKSAAFKASIVSQDFTESKLREILNYGHTLGHAIEKLENYALRHGEAVSIGLVFAAQLSVECGELPQSLATETKDLLSKFGLPVRYSATAFEKLLDLMKGDKKSRGAQLRFIGISSVATPIWLEAVTPAILQKVYERISS